MKTLVTIDGGNFDPDRHVQPEWIVKMGGYNDLPEPHREVDVHRFLHVSGTYSPTAIDTRQVVFKHPNKPHLTRTASVTILFYHNCAMAFVYPTSWITVRDNKLCGEGTAPIEKAENASGIEYDLSECRFFEIGCQHEYTEISQEKCRERGISHSGNCWHVEECDICGHIHAYDSSG